MCTQKQQPLPHHKFPLHTARTLRGRASGAEWVAPVVCKQNAHMHRTRAALRFSINNSHSSLCFFAPPPPRAPPDWPNRHPLATPPGQKALARTTRAPYIVYTHTHPVAPRWRPTATSRAAVSLCAAAAAMLHLYRTGGPANRCACFLNLNQHVFRVSCTQRTCTKPAPAQCTQRRTADASIS